MDDRFCSSLVFVVCSTRSITNALLRMLSSFYVAVLIDYTISVRGQIHKLELKCAEMPERGIWIRVLLLLYDMLARGPHAS